MPAPMTPTHDDRAARATWAAHYATPDGFRYMPAEELVRFCGRQRGLLGRVLEVGCGNGANLWYLAEQPDVTRVNGVDFCEEALQAARELCVRRGVALKVNLRNASAYDLSGFPDGAFDTVVDSMVSQHFPWADHDAVYREYRRVMRRGGRLFVYHLAYGTTGSLHGRRDYPYGIRLFPEAGRVCLPQPRDLADVVAASGFDPIERRGMSRTYPDGRHAKYAVIEGTAA